MIIVAETTHVCVHEQGVQEYRIASGFGITINDLLPLQYTIVQVTKTILLLLLI